MPIPVLVFQEIFVRLPRVLQLAHSCADKAGILLKAANHPRQGLHIALCCLDTHQCASRHDMVTKKAIGQRGHITPAFRGVSKKLIFEMGSTYFDNRWLTSFNPRDPEGCWLSTLLWGLFSCFSIFCFSRTWGQSIVKMCKFEYWNDYLAYHLAWCDHRSYLLVHDISVLKNCIVLL